MFPKKTIRNIISTVTLLVPSLSFAAETLENPLKSEYSTFPALIEAFLNIIIRLGTPVVALFFVYTGFTFVTSQGDPKKLDTAKSMFWWTVIGAALVLGAKVILTVLQGTITSITKPV